ncbi:MAG TPA: GAF domain-containing sensor histidine kinase [Candidatus Acidoferrales bacterium]|nr:GAF domain-containing sensor histidine kinase [Candidatus Acidoferrales bacterium]
MVFTIYQVAVFFVMAAITSFTVYQGKHGGYDTLVGWKYLPIGLSMITFGMVMGNLKPIVPHRFTTFYNIVQYFGLYLPGISLIGYAMVKLIPGITEYMGILAEKKYLEQSKAFTKHLLKLQESGIVLASPGSLGDVLQRVVSIAQGVTGAYFSAIFLFNSRSNMINASYYSGRGGETIEKLVETSNIDLRNVELPADKLEFLKRLAAGRKPYISSDCREFLDFYMGDKPVPDAGLLDQWKVREFVLVPLSIDNISEGILCYLFPNGDYSQVLLELFANQCSLAMRNAKLFDDMQQNTIALEVQRRKAENANRSKTEFLANMSHELRTPLNAIIGFSEVLNTDLHEMPPEMTHQFIGHINHSGRHLLELVNDLLDLSRLEIGRLKLEKSRFKLYDELAQAVEIVQPMAAEKKITIHMEIEESLGEIFADPQKLRQIVINLLSNAVKFSHMNSEIDLTVRKNEESIHFCVEDFGMGIKAEDIERLFKPFEQLTQNPYAKKYRGVGLGLALTRRLVELHGGRVWAESEISRGSKFFFTIPQ